MAWNDPKEYECVNGHKNTIGDIKNANSGESHGSGYAECPDCDAIIRPFP